MISAFLLLALIALCRSQSSHDQLGDLLQQSQDRRLTDPEVTQAVALAQAAGRHEVAQVLGERLQLRRDAQQLVPWMTLLVPPPLTLGGMEEDEPSAAEEVDMTSPLAGVSEAAWRRYVLASRPGQQTTVTAGWQLGYFLLGARALQDVGVMTNVRRSTWQGREVWVGDFQEPWTLATWLASPADQYRAFAALTSLHDRQLQAELPTAVGIQVAGQTVTRSGLLGLAKQAGGVVGARCWLTRPADRCKFVNTTQRFQAVNGVF